MLAATMGRTFYAQCRSNYCLEYCYRVKVGAYIDSKWSGYDRNRPHFGSPYCATQVTYSGSAYYVIGNYNAAASSGSSQAYAGGSSCGSGGVARSGTLTLNVLGVSLGGLQMDVTEYPLCVYSITLHGSVEDFGLASCG